MIHIDPWARYCSRNVWCPTCGQPSPALADHHEAGDWAEAHTRDCHPAAETRAA